MTQQPRIHTTATRLAILAICLAIPLSGCEGDLSFVTDPGGSAETDAIDPETIDAGRLSNVVLDEPPPPAQMRRLTQQQIANSLVATFGSEPIEQVESELPPDETVEMFLSIGASKVGTSPRDVELYNSFAIEVAGRVMASRDDHEALQGCAFDTASEPCVADAITDLGGDLWRRPLTDDEVARYLAIVEAAPADNVLLGMQYAIAGMLQSPNFLYLAHNGEPGEDGLYHLTDWELASQLSFLIWNAPPDDELRAAAAAGELSTAGELAAQAKRMLDDPRARSLAYRFFAQSWEVDELHVGLHSPDDYPNWSQALIDSYKREFELVIEEIVWEEKADIRRVLDAEYTWVDAAIAETYGYDAPTEDGFVRVPHGERRFGLLTSGAVIASHSNSKNFLPVHRGVFVLERILCIDPPPPNQEALEATEETLDKLSQSDEVMTPREIIETHASDAKCAGCHRLFDPLGFTYGNYDRIGQWQESYQDRPIDAVGDFGGTILDGVGDLSRYLADDERVTDCMAKNVYSFALGRHLAPSDRVVVDALADEMRADGHGFQALVMDIVSAPTFRTVAPPGYQTPDEVTQAAPEE